MMNRFRICTTRSRSLTKQELIDMINATFPDDKSACIAVLTTCKATDDTDENIIMQSLTFGKPLGRNRGCL